MKGITLENFTNDYLLFIEWLSQFDKGEVPQIQKVNLGNQKATILIKVSEEQYKDLKAYIKNNR